MSFSPSYDYVALVLRPTLAAIGLPLLAPALARRGWSTGARGTGEWTLIIPPREGVGLGAFSLLAGRPDPADGAPVRVKAVFLGPPETHATFREALPRVLAAGFGRHYGPGYRDLGVECEDSGDRGRMYLLVTATGRLASSISGTSNSSSGTDARDDDDDERKLYTLGADYLGPYASRKASSPSPALVTKALERVVRDLVAEWLSGACVDEHMRDQLVVFAALAEGQSVIHPGQASPGQVFDASVEHDRRDAGARREKDKSEERRVKNEEKVKGDVDLVEREPSLHTRTAEVGGEAATG